MKEERRCETEGTEWFRLSSAAGPSHGEILLHTSSRHSYRPNLYISADGRPSLTSLSCVQCLFLTQVLTTDGCCGVSEAWLIYSGFGWGLGTVLWKSSALSTVYFGSLVFWHSAEGQCPREPLNQRTAWEINPWFGHILDMLSAVRAGESLVCPLLGLLDKLWWI